MVIFYIVLGVILVGLYMLYAGLIKKHNALKEADRLFHDSKHNSFKVDLPGNGGRKRMVVILAQEEEILVPAFVEWLQIGVFAVAVWLLSFVQSIWSLPQQVHIRSIIHKTLNK